MKYEVTKEYLEEILNFLGTLPYVQVKRHFDALAANVKPIVEAPKAVDEPKEEAKEA